MNKFVYITLYRIENMQYTLYLEPHNRILCRGLVAFHYQFQNLGLSSTLNKHELTEAFNSSFNNSIANLHNSSKNKDTLIRQ